MATVSRSASRLYRSVPHTPYVCSSCRAQPAARYMRRMASTTTTIAPTDATEVAAVAPRSPTVAKPITGTSTRYATPRDDPNYVPAATWHGLENVGTKAWKKKAEDNGEAFAGWSRKGKMQITTKNIQNIMSQIKEPLSAHGVVEETQLITEPAIKRELVAQVAQVTGHRLSDFLMQGPISLRDVKKLLLIKPKTSTLTAQKTEAAASLPNVKVSERRQTRIDKDIEQGRWKLIKKALEERDLPVLASESTKPSRLL